MNFFDYFILYYLHLHFGPTYVVTGLLLSLIVSVMFNPFEKKWRFMLRLVIDWACVFVVHLFINCLNYWAIEMAGTPEVDLYSKFYIWPIIIFLHVLYPTKPVRLSLRITNAIITSTFFIMALTFSGNFGRLVMESTNNYSAFADATNYLLFFFVIVVLFVLNRLSVNHFKYVKNNLIIILNSVFLVSYVILIIAEALLDGASTQLYQGLMGIFLMAMDTLAYVLFYFTIKGYNAVIDSQAVALKAESEKNQLEIANSKYEEMHRIRHDIKNQFQYVDQLVKEKQYDKLDQYLSDLSETVHFAVDYVDCGNDTLNRVLNLEKSKAEAQNIKLEVKAAVPPKLQMQDKDLVSLVANLLDNAIEAAVLAKSEVPIHSEFTYEGNYLILVITNPVAESVTKETALKLKSTKAERANHGYGTKIIQSIVNQYHGYVNYDVENHLFTAKIMVALAGDFDEEEKE
jgi:signal transduction histidine kinase